MFHLALGDMPASLTDSAFARARDLPGPERRKVRQLLTAATAKQAAAQPAIARLAELILVLFVVEAGVLGRPAGLDGAGYPPARERSGTWSAATSRIGWPWPPRAGAALAIYLMHEHRPPSRRAPAAAYEEARAAAARLCSLARARRWSPTWPGHSRTGAGSPSTRTRSCT